VSDELEQRLSLMEQRVSPTVQAIPADELGRLAAAAPTPAEAGWAAPDAPRVVLTEEALQRLVIDYFQGKRIPPADPEARVVAERIWAELDARPAGAIVFVPPSIPDAA